MKKIVLWHQVFRLYSLTNMFFEDQIYTICHNCCERIKFNDKTTWETFPHRNEDCIRVRKKLLESKEIVNEE